VASLNDIQKALDALNKQFSNLGKNSPFSGKTAKEMVMLLAVLKKQLEL